MKMRKDNLNRINTTICRISSTRPFIEGVCENTYYTLTREGLHSTFARFVVYDGSQATNLYILRWSAY